MENILLTGANRGIGLELTRQALQAGSRVWAACRQPEKADELRALQAAYQAQLFVLPLDVTDEATIQTAFTAVSRQTSSLDLLINNAGILYRGETLANFDPERMRHTFDVNVLGVMRVTSRFVPLLRQGNRPRLINISSQLGSLQAMDTDWGMLSYNSSKAALNMITRKLAHELARDGITVIALHPGWVQTDMGGPHAAVTVPDSARGILTVAGRLDQSDSGKFFTYTGVEHPW